MAIPCGPRAMPRASPPPTRTSTSAASCAPRRSSTVGPTSSSASQTAPICSDRGMPASPPGGAGIAVKTSMRRHTLLVLLACAACRLVSPPTVPIDPVVDFAAHIEHDRIVVDRLPDGNRGVVEAPGWFRWGGAPTFVLTRDGQTVAGLWLTAPATVRVRGGRSPMSPIVTDVDPSWDDNAISLTLRPAGGALLRTSTFERTVTGGGPPVLSRIAQTSVDVRGTYRAVVRNAQGGEVGWLRVKISPYQESPRIYDGVLPSDVAPGTAAAIAVALCSEIDWIENHTL